MAGDQMDLDIHGLHDYYDATRAAQDQRPLVDFENWRPQTLNLIKVYERKYKKDNHPIYEYEFRIKIEEDTENNNPVVRDAEGEMAVFSNYSRIGFGKNDIVGLKENSLKVYKMETDTATYQQTLPRQIQNTFDTSRDSHHSWVEVEWKQIENTIQFDFSISLETHGDKSVTLRTNPIEATFSFYVKEKLDLNVANLTKFTISPTAHQYEGNNRIIGVPLITNLLKFGSGKVVGHPPLHDATGHFSRDHGQQMAGGPGNDEGGDNGNDPDDRADDMLADDFGDIRIYSNMAGSTQGNTRRTHHSFHHNAQRNTEVADDTHSAGGVGGRLVGGPPRGGAPTQVGGPTSERSSYKRAKERFWEYGSAMIDTFLYKKPKITAPANTTKITVIIEMLQMSSFIAQINISKSVLELKKLIHKTMGLNKFKALGINEMRILLDGMFLEDNTVLGDIPSISQRAENNPTAIRMALVTHEPTRPADFQHREPNPQLTEQQKEAFKQVHTLRTLLRNLKACNSNATQRMLARERVRFNHPETKTEPNITSADLGQIVLELAHEIRTYSESLSRLSDKMIKDRQLDPQSQEFKDFQQDIQNVMDFSRYANPALKCMAMLVVPLQRNSPRMISSMNNQAN